MDQCAKQGLFACKIVLNKGKVEVELTGDHYGPDERGVATAMARSESALNVAEGRSPIYLVKDSVIDFAHRVYRIGLKHELSGCHSGHNGEPCGKCERCKATAREQFTMVVLGSLELQECDLSKNLMSAVESAVGLSWTDAPWARAMTHDEVERVFDLMGIKTKEGE